ncbi:MAG: hypothetical protein PVI92_08500 [Chromatiales bacterium]
MGSSGHIAQALDLPCNIEISSGLRVRLRFFIKLANSDVARRAHSETTDTGVWTPQGNQKKICDYLVMAVAIATYMPEMKIMSAYRELDTRCFFLNIGNVNNFDIYLRLKMIPGSNAACPASSPAGIQSYHAHGA